MFQRQISQRQDSGIKDQTKYKVGIPTCDNWFGLTAATVAINQFRHFVPPNRSDITNSCYSLLYSKHTAIGSRC
jgi:hypothetical protein